MKKGIGEWYNLKLGIKDHQDLIKSQIQGAWTREAEKGKKKNQERKRDSCEIKYTLIAI